MVGFSLFLALIFHTNPEHKFSVFRDGCFSDDVLYCYTV